MSWIGIQSGVPWRWLTTATSASTVVVGTGDTLWSIAERVARVLALADEFGLPVVSPRAEAERAGIVVVEPLPERLTAQTAALFNHGVSATVRDGRVRLSPHAGTTEETIGMLRAALSAYATAVRPVR